MRRNHHRLLRATLLAGLALLTAAAMTQPAWPAMSTPTTPAPERWLPVTLGTHQFGHLRAPDATAATAGPTQVGFWSPPPGHDGITYGPPSFDLPRDGSIWLNDLVNRRLLRWPPGQRSGPVPAVKLPDLRALGDIAVARDGTSYIPYSDKNQRVPGLYFNMSLVALSPSGQLRWTGPTIISYANGRLRFGPDGALYWPDSGGDGSWTRLVTPAGRLLTIAEQRQQTQPDQPLAGGRRLLVTKISDHEWRVVLLNQAGRALRGWRITSQTELWSMDPTPALVGGDPVLVLDAVKVPTKGRLLWESLVLRLGPNGGTLLRFPVPPTDRVTWGDTPTTGLRIGPDGQLYQLRTDPAWGARIVRWSLQPPTPIPPTTTTTPGGAVPPSTVTPPPVSHALAPTVPAPTTPPTQQPTPPVQQPTSPVQAQPAGRSILPWVAAIATPALLAAVGGWWWYRRRHPTGPRRHGPPRPAH